MLGEKKLNTVFR